MHHRDRSCSQIWQKNCTRTWKTHSKKVSQVTFGATGVQITSRQIQLELQVHNKYMRAAPYRSSFTQVIANAKRTSNVCTVYIIRSLHAVACSRPSAKVPFEGYTSKTEMNAWSSRSSIKFVRKWWRQLTVEIRHKGDPDMIFYLRAPRHTTLIITVANASCKSFGIQNVFLPCAQL